LNQGDIFVDRFDEDAGTAAEPVARNGPRPISAPPAADGPRLVSDTVGGMLRQARESAGLSLDVVADRTKVRPGVLHLIEQDAHDRLPALTYTLGFVKAYARTVGLDPAAAAERYRRESRKGEPVPAVVDLQPLDEQRRPPRRLLWWSSATVAALLIGLWAWGAGWLSEDMPPPVAAVRPAPARPAAPAPAPLAPDMAAGPIPSAAPALALVADTEVWARIATADGKETLFLGIMQPGQTLAIPPGKEWRLHTGRAGALRPKLGDRLLEPLGGAAERLKGFPLDQEHLLARGSAVAAGAEAPGAAAAPSGPAPSGQP